MVETGNAASGAATGKRQHKPFSIVRSIETSGAKTKMSVVGTQQLAQAKAMTNRDDRQFLATSIGRAAATGPVARYYLENAWPTG